MVQESTNLLRVVEACHNHQMVWVEELDHYSQKEIEEYHNNQWVEEELHHLMAMVMVMVIVMVIEEVIDHLPPRRNGNDNGDGDGDDSPPPSDHGQPRHRRGQRNRWVYVVQGPPGPPGQPGQDGRDGHDGHAPQLPRGMINVPGAAPAPLDTTGLENSFENLGRTMVDVLAMQQQTNLTLQDQIRRANDAQIDQTLAMHDLADITEQRTYDSMFAAVPIYHGKDDEDFDEWADQLEALCEISHRNIHHEMMGRSSAAVKKIIRSIDPNLRWSLARQELKRCVSDEKSITHSAFKLNTLVQKPNENVCMYIIKYANFKQ